MMKKSNSWLVAIVAMAIFAATAAQAVPTHKMPLADLQHDGFIPTTGVLVFPGVTLADLEGCSYWGVASGSAISAVKNALSNKVKPFPAGATGDAITRYDFDLVTREGNTPKAVHIQLYNGDGGVYAKAVKAWYVGSLTETQCTNELSKDHYTVDQSTGALTWSGVSNSGIATAANANDYGIRAIGVARPLTTVSTLAFPGLTVAQIAKDAKAKLSVRLSGTYIGTLYGISTVIANPVVISGTEANPTAIRCEAQFIDSTLLKCVAFELSDGEGGVCVRIAGGYYRSELTLGEPMLDASGTPLSGVGVASVPSVLLDAGYGLFNLEANEEARVEGGTTYSFDRNVYLTTTAQLIFPGATLAELEGCMFHGKLDGGWINNGATMDDNGYTHIVKRYPSSAEEPVQKLFPGVAIWDGGYTKFVIVELTNGSGGVYGRALLAGNRKDNYSRSDFFSVKSDGSGVTLASGFSGTTLVTRDHDSGYGLKKLAATRFATGTARLAFPGKTVAEIFRGDILGKNCGGAIDGINQFKDYLVCNKVVTSTDPETGAITGFHVELQTGTATLKCVELSFTDGEGGVWVKVVRTCYVATSYNTLGRRMVMQDDSGRAQGTTGYNIAGTFWADGYAACEIAVALPDDAATGPATAVWNGGDPALAASWECKSGDGTVLAGALPDRYTQVLLPAGTTTMSADADLRPYASVMTVASGLAIDTAGHKLYVSTLEPWHACTVTDTVGGGELHIDLAEGVHSYNTQIALSGKLKLVKDGKGLFIPNKTNQAYTGGTEIAAGTVLYGTAGTFVNNWGMGGNGIENANAQIIRVDEGARIDINGNYFQGYVTYKMNGGEMYGRVLSSNRGVNAVIDLEADSYVTTIGDTLWHGTHNLNGHMLNATIKSDTYFYLWRKLVGPGTLNLVSGGYFEINENLPAAERDMRDVDFIVTSALKIKTDVSIRDYYASYNANFNTLSGSLNVYGTFTPTTAYFTGATMQDGSTIDLRERTLPWSARSSFSNGNQLKIADGANIALRLPEITIPDGADLVSTNIVVVTNLANNVDFDVSRITCDLSCVRTESGHVPQNIKLESSGTGISIAIKPYFYIKVK